MEMSTSQSANNPLFTDLFKTRVSRYDLKHTILFYFSEYFM